MDQAARFTLMSRDLLALDREVALDGGVRAQQVLDAANGYVQSKARLTGTYRRGS